MKFYSEVLDELFDTQEALEQAEATEKTKCLDATKEAEIARIKGYRARLDELKAEFEEINETRKGAEFAFLDTYGDDAWVENFANAEEKEIFEGLKKLKAALGIEDAGKAEKPRKPRVEVTEAHGDLGTAIREFLKGVH
jgi:hypothetical protein